MQNMVILIDTNILLNYLTNREDDYLEQSIKIVEMCAVGECTGYIAFHTLSTLWYDNRDYKNVEKKLYGHNAKNMMSTDIKETADSYEMVVDLPGFKKEDVTVELDKGYLTITAAKGLEQNEAESEEAKKEGKYIRKERYSGEYKRSFYVGDYLTQEDIKAKFKHGLLTLDFPKKETPKVAANKFIAIEG